MTTESKPDTNPLSKFDAPALKGIQSTALTTPAAAFLPANMSEAMELGKLMAASNFVPPHLRSKPGDCLAVVMQATRWEMDPFAVAGKTYFVQDRIAYESQLVTAVVNSRAPLVGRLQFEYTGEGNNLVCTVSGKLKGDPRDKIVVQEMATITTRNSPLWKQSPRQQLGYYTQRLWARLHCPEVLMGVYTVDEMQDAGTLVERSDGTYGSAPPRPIRADYAEPERQVTDETVTAEKEYRFESYNHWGECSLKTDDPVEFADEVIGLFDAAGDRRTVDTLIENNAKQPDYVPEDQKSAITTAMQAALARTEVRTAGPKKVAI